MKFVAITWLAASLAAAQAPPPEQDQALRARVNQFLSCYVDGSFRKAIDLVAEESKDAYFAVQKNKILSFEITEISYSENFARAAVTVRVERKVRIHPEFPETVLAGPLLLDWKVEDGKWMFVMDRGAFPKNLMSPAPVPDAPAPAAAPPPGNIPDLSPKAMQARAKEIMKGSGLDRPSVSFVIGKAGTAVVNYRNGQPGGIQVFLLPVPKVEGLSAEIDKTILKPEESAAVTIKYDPGKQAPPSNATIILQVEPFGWNVPIQVTFTK